MLRASSFQQMNILSKAGSWLCIAMVGMITLAGCNSGEQVPDVSGIKVNLQTQRFDRDLSQLDTNNMGAGLKGLEQKYPYFLNFFLDTLMRFEIKGNYSDSTPGIKAGLRVFLTNKDYKGLFDSVNKHFPATRGLEEQLTKGFQYMTYYYPQYKVPHVVYFISWLNNWAAFTLNDNTLGIGLDMFLGDKYPFYKSVGLPEYMNTHFRPDYIPVAAFTAIYNDMYPFEVDGKNLLNMIIQKGKQQYFLKKVLPFVADSTRYGYTQKQLDWCKNNEGEVYNFFVREGLFYETNWQKILRYVNDGPNSTGMPPQSPGNIGSWLGYQIVAAYMKEHPKTTLDQLFKNGNEQQFLQESRYKPK